MYSEILRMPDSIMLALPNSMTKTLSVLSFNNEYQFTQRVKPSAPLDKRWTVQIQASNLNEEHWEELLSWIDICEGSSSIFSAWVGVREVPLGVANGIGGKRPATTQFSDQTTFRDGTQFVGQDFRSFVNRYYPKGSKTIEIKSLVANTSKVLNVGDEFGILHGERRIETLYRCTRPAHSDSSGVAFVDIAPDLRYPIQANDIVNWHRPRTTYRFREQPEVQISAPMRGRVNMDLVEFPEVLYEREIS